MLSLTLAGVKHERQSERMRASRFGGHYGRRARLLKSSRVLIVVERVPTVSEVTVRFDDACKL